MEQVFKTNLDKVRVHQIWFWFKTSTGSFQLIFIWLKGTFIAQLPCTALLPDVLAPQVQQVGLNKTLFLKLHKLTKLVSHATRSGNILSISVGRSEKIVTSSKPATISNWGQAGKTAAACFSVGNSCYISSCTLLSFCQDCSLSMPGTLYLPHLPAVALKFHVLSSPFLDFQPNRQVQLTGTHYISQTVKTRQIWSSKFITLHPSRNGNYLKHSLNISAKSLQ